MHKNNPEIVFKRAYELYKHSFDKWGMEYPEWKQRVSEDISRVRAIHAFTIIMKEIPSKQNITDVEELKTMFETETKKIKDDEPGRMSFWNEWDTSGNEFEMNLPMYIGPVLIETIFDHCFERDIADGTDSPEEIEFVNKTKEMRANYKAHSEIRLFSFDELKAYDDFYVQYFEKFRKDMGTPKTATSL